MRNDYSGHGHVIPRADGVKARCGGPALCAKCAHELAELEREEAASLEKAKALFSSDASAWDGVWQDAEGLFTGCPRVAAVEPKEIELAGDLLSRAQGWWYDNGLPHSTVSRIALSADGFVRFYWYTPGETLGVARHEYVVTLSVVLADSERKALRQAQDERAAMAARAVWVGWDDSQWPHFSAGRVAETQEPATAEYLNCLAGELRELHKNLRALGIERLGTIRVRS